MKPLDELETGEPPGSVRHSRHRMYAEHMNTLAQSGASRYAEHEYEGPFVLPPDGTRSGHRGVKHYPPGLLQCEIDEAERIWAKLPKWEDLLQQPHAV